MRTILAKIEATNYAGITAEEEIEVNDNDSDEDIEKIVWDWAVDHMMIETSWEEIETN